MSVVGTSGWQTESLPVVEQAKAGAADRHATLNEKLHALRDTLIVVGMQVTFRITMFLRHLNY